MYGGQVMEECRAAELEQAQHPYTRGLLDCLPRLDGAREELAVLQRDPAWLEPRGGSR
jgi:peptide/nickel transport system ATP-binding protein